MFKYFNHEKKQPQKCIVLLQDHNLTHLTKLEKHLTKFI